MKISEWSEEECLFYLWIAFFIMVGTSILGITVINNLGHRHEMLLRYQYCMESKLCDSLGDNDVIVE